MSSKNVRQVIVTDGSPLQLATAIVCLAYNLPYGEGTAEKLAESLGLADTPQQTTDFETAYSYPNAVCLTQDDQGRMTVYLYDTRQEEIRDGEPLPGLIHEPEKGHATAATLTAAEVAPPASGAQGAEGATIEGKTLDLMDDDELPEGVVPGETIGWPADNVTGKAIRMTDAERQRIIDAGPIGDADGTTAEGVSAENEAPARSKAHIAGGEAYHDGKAFADNPYPADDGTHDHNDWADGFSEAEAEAAGDDEGDGVNEESDEDRAVRDAYNSGVEAHAEGLTDGDNPYNAETQQTLHDEWARGLSEGGDATKAE